MPQVGVAGVSARTYIERGFFSTTCVQAILLKVSLPLHSFSDGTCPILTFPLGSEYITMHTFSADTLNISVDDACIHCSHLVHL